jgi:hypothetical protein
VLGNGVEQNPLRVSVQGRVRAVRNSLNIINIRPDLRIEFAQISFIIPIGDDSSPREMEKKTRGCPTEKPRDKSIQ